MTRILFVDDDPNVLAGLRDLLRRDRHRWEMAFANSGAVALDMLRSGSFDIIITDMRMPGMDGAALLHHVKRDFPSIARIVLSGHADQGGVISAVPVAQQFLSKPCDDGTLRTVIERIATLQTVLRSDTIRDLVGRIGRLPSMPDVYWDLTRAIASGRASMRVVTDIVERDPAMAAKILQIVNSSYFGLAVSISSIERAITHLGLDLVKSLTLSAHVFGLLGSAKTPSSLATLQERSLAGARLARHFAANGDSDSAFTAAMLRDIGQVVLAVGSPERSDILAKRAELTGKPLHVVERERLGVSHAEVGAYLLGLWGLPLSIVEAVAYHHDPGQAPASDRSLLAIVHVADGLTNDHWRAGTETAPWLDSAFVEAADLGGLLPTWRSIADELFAGASPGATK